MKQQASRWLCRVYLCKLFVLTAHWTNLILSSMLLHGWLWTMFAERLFLRLWAFFFCCPEELVSRRRAIYPRRECYLLIPTARHTREVWRSLIGSGYPQQPTLCRHFCFSTLWEKTTSRLHSSSWVTSDTSFLDSCLRRLTWSTYFTLL